MPNLLEYGEEAGPEAVPVPKLRETTARLERIVKENASGSRPEAHVPIRAKHALQLYISQHFQQR